MELLVKNSTIVTSTRIFQGDILIAKGKIKAIGENLNASTSSVRRLNFNLKLNLVKTIDAKGKLVFPGGIDQHVHFYLPTSAG